MSDTLTSTNSQPDIYAARARNVIRKYHSRPEHAAILATAPELKTLVEAIDTTVSATLPVCIIGAGMAGLYTAMIFDDLGIPYELLEAADEDRVGGRLFTYKFPQPTTGSYEYYDVGAMRFPDSPFMKRTFDLARDKLAGKVTLIDYHLQAKDTFLYYNKTQFKRTGPDVKISPKPNQVGATNYVGTKYADKDADSIMSDVIKHFRNFFEEGPIDTAIKKLMEFDQYSTRSYMALGHNPPLEKVGNQPPFPSSVINFCETMDKSTGWYDRGLTETVLESLAFDWPGKKAKWHCFDGGSQTLPIAMHNKLKTKAQFKTKVTAIKDFDHSIVVTSTSPTGAVKDTTYRAVVSTVPISRLSVMDLTKCNLDYAQWNAIRELQYGPSIKIGIRFKEPWWETLPSGKIVGGQTYSDLPIRTTVYPSYPPGDGTKSRVLIASYCWTQDAERLGALINGDGSCKPELLDMVMRNLAVEHGVEVNDITKHFENKPENVFAWDWLHDELTMGAFAFFGPQQFSDRIYGALTTPAANNKLFIAGEATSSCHAWVAGALDSAWRAVEQYLILHKYPDTTKNKFHTNWGISEYWDEKTTDEHGKTVTTSLMTDHLRLSIAHDIVAGA